MSKPVLSLIVASLIALVIVSGCIFPDVEAINKVKANPVAKDFLAEHTMAQLTASAWSEVESRQRLLELVEKCGAQVNPTDYYYVAFSEGDALLEGWVFQHTMNVACVHRSDDQCITDVDCDDGLACTRNECDGIPKKCSAFRIRECAGGDGCCPGGCTYALDFDCPMEMDECRTDAECDDGNESTIGTCTGSPKKCGYETVIGCVDGDNVCEPWCDNGDDSDCSVKACVTGGDCNDRDPLTLDFCEDNICKHKKVTECADNDGYCPPRCTYNTDSDCLANPGNFERVIVTCGGISTNVDAALQQSGNDLIATFDSVVNNTTNSALKSYTALRYKYNYMETGNYGTQIGLQTSMSERIRIQGKAVYNNAEKTSYFYFNKNGFQYEVEFYQGIPATKTPTTTEPFSAGNGDRIPAVLFGTDSLVTTVSQKDGNQQASLLSDYVELSVTGNASIGRIAGKDGWDYSIRVARCDEDSAIFSLYLRDNLIESQTVTTGSIIFPDKLKDTVRINYFHRDNVTGKCDYKYAKGAYIENFYQGKQFPADYSKVVPWVVNLAFENNKLRKIQLNNSTISNEIMKPGDIKWVLKEGNTEGTGFCQVKFYGLVR